jgi:hypothetical protein
MAAGWLVLSEAGGLVGGLAGRPADPSMVVAAASGLYAGLDEVVAAAVARVGQVGPAS